MTKIRVDVRLKNGVLDPAGEAVADAIRRLGFSGVSDVRIGKLIELEVAAPDAERVAKDIAEKVLINPIIETCRVEAVK